MNKTLSTLALALAAALLPATADAIGRSALKQVQERYRSERAVCLNGQSNQSLQTCLREAEAVRAQALKADLDDGAGRPLIRGSKKKRGPGCWPGPRQKASMAYFLVPSFTASFTSPTAFCVWPSTCFLMP